MNLKNLNALWRKCHSKWVFPKNRGGKPPKLDGLFHGNPLFFNGFVGVKTTPIFGPTPQNGSCDSKLPPPARWLVEERLHCYRQVFW